nr:transcription initiation factor TFIID subunit 12b [Aegilops tauschii subsp. strangulata]XP_045090968.1 transcription initiation factor TFIID subunit 12b [Aegilops tauschii subsp. strangulata]
MADPPSVAAIVSPQPDQLGGSASAPQNSNPNSLLSPQIPPSPTVSDLSVISSPQLDPAAAAAGGGSADFPPRPQQLQAPSPTQAVAGAGGYGQIQRSGSASRLAAVSQLPQYSAATARMYGGQMSFSGGGAQLGQQQQLAARAAMLGQGQLGMMQGQGSAASAAHYGLQSQMMAQPRQKGMVQGAQFNTANAAQALQGMQSMGVMGTLGMNQMRPNGTIPYAQQRFAQAQMRPQQASQQAALSPQKGVAQGLSRTASITGLNSQLPGVSQNGQMMQMSPSQQQQQWLKQMQSSLASPSQHQIQQQQRMLLMQQLQKGLTPHQIAQAQQQHSPHLNAQQLLQQQHIMQQLQQQQQQQSPRMSASGSQKSANLTGSQPGTPLSGGTMAGGSGSQGAEGTNQLLGKRKIQDLVAQVDPLGKLDPEVEDLVLEIADDFIESVTAFACTLAKHRKSSVLEAKDVLLHLQRNWHLTVPGFSKEDKHPQRNYVKAVVDPQQPECDAAGVRSASNKLVANNSIANHQTRGPVADPSATSTVGPLSKVPRF